VQIPPLTDYPNHLAREYVLASGLHDPIVAAMYSERWQIIPNLAIDVVMPWLAHIVPLYVAGRIMLGLAALLLVLGTAAYHRSVFGRLSFWPLASGLIAYNGLFLLGFLNFEVGLGLGLLGAAAWQIWSERRPILNIFLSAAISTAIFFTHIFGLVLLFAIIGGVELDRLLLIRGGVRERLAWIGWTALRLVGFLPPVILSLLSPIAHAGGPTIWPSIPRKLFLFISPFLSYGRIPGTAIAALFLALFCVLLWKKRLVLAPGARWTLAVLVAVYLVCPSVLNDTAFIADRFPIMVMLMLFAAVMPAGLSVVERSGMVLLLTAMFAIRMGGISAVWYHHTQDLAEIRSAIAPVPAGAKVLIVSVNPDDNRAYWRSAPLGRDIPGLMRTDVHLPALLLIEHQAFWPELFAAPGKQPIVLRPAFDRLSDVTGIPLSYHDLQSGPVDPSKDQFWADWRKDFDYVLMLNAGGDPDLDHFLPGQLTLLTHNDMAALFKVVR
jgi:MFS family permease